MNFLDERADLLDSFIFFPALVGDLVWVQSSVTA